MQNYPNPFNPVTTINFSLPEKTFVDLSVYDILGNKIQTLLSEEIDVGKHSVNFNAESLSSGVYIYKLNGNDFSFSRKMQLIK